PLVRKAITVAILFGRDETVGGVVLPAIDLVGIAGGRNLDAIDATVRTRIRPGIRHAVVFLREPDFDELSLLVVVLPAVNRAVLVPVDAASDRPGPVHFRPGVDATVFVGVVGELGQLASGLVV